MSMTSVESLYAADLAPCSAVLVQTDLSCHAIEAQGVTMGSGVIARVPTIGLLSTSFVRESWAPFQIHAALLASKCICSMQIRLIDSDTGELIRFTDKRSWHLVFSVEYVHVPSAITREAVDNEIGLELSNVTHNDQDQNVHL